MDVAKIDAFGGHLGWIQGIQGRASSWLHYSKVFDRKQLAGYYVDWAQANPGNRVKLEGGKEAVRVIQVVNKACSELGEDFTKVDRTILAEIMGAFHSAKSRRQLTFVLGHLNEIMKAAGGKALDVNELKKSLKDVDLNDVEAAVKKIVGDIQSAGKKTETVWRGFKETFSFEVLFAACSYIFTTMPWLITPGGFMAFFLAGAVAGGLAPIAVAAGQGFYKNFDSDSLFDMGKGLVEAAYNKWVEMRDSDSSFHPVVDSLLVSFLITWTWGYIDTLQKAAQVGSILKRAMEWGMRDFTYYYSSMNVIFAWKSALHKGNLFSKEVPYEMVIGGIRGMVKNASMGVVDIDISERLLRDHHDILTSTYTNFFESIVRHVLDKGKERLFPGKEEETVEPKKKKKRKAKAD